MRRAAKVDANQREVVAALRGAGASVQLLHAVGEGNARRRPKICFTACETGDWGR